MGLYDEDWISVRQAAAEWGVDEKLIRRAAKKHKVLWTRNRVIGGMRTFYQPTQLKIAVAVEAEAEVARRELKFIQEQERAREQEAWEREDWEQKKREREVKRNAVRQTGDNHGGGQSNEYELGPAEDIPF